MNLISSFDLTMDNSTHQLKNTQSSLKIIYPLYLYIRQLVLNYVLNRSLHFPSPHITYYEGLYFSVRLIVLFVFGGELSKCLPHRHSVVTLMVVLLAGHQKTVRTIGHPGKTFAFLQHGFTHILS